MAKLFRITTVPISVEKLLGKQLSFMDRYFDVTAISSDQVYLERVGKELGVKTHTINMTRKITPVEDLKSLWTMYAYFRKEKPEIVHSHTPKAGLIGMLAAKLAGVKIRLHTVAGLPLMETTGLKRKVLNLVEKLTYSCATKVYPNSKGLHDFILEEKLGTADKIQVIGNGSTNGIDTAHFSPESYSVSEKAQLRQELEIEPSAFVFVFVGRLVKDKGINELVSAFMKIQTNSSKKLKLLLVGPLEQDLDPLAPDVLQTIDSNPDIISLGFQKDVRPYFAIGDALVFPSYREGFPNVVLQALSMGIPALVSDINGCNEIVQDGYNGSIFPAKDEIALQKSMEQILADHFYETFKANSRSSIMKYEQQVIWNLLKENYDNLLKQHGL
ncbi:MAG: glycosyltransferase family 1 protein [Chryseobacterium sp.]|nr:MAG: glycosyltransferase family 1 protein [Chryseobacterium sp.]